MIPKHIKNLLLPLFAMLMSCSSSEPDQINNIEWRNIELTPAESDIAKSQYQFPVKILSEIHKAIPDDNVMISPLGVSMLLGMIVNAVDMTERVEILNLLNIKEDELNTFNNYNHRLIEQLPFVDDNSVFNFSNGFWGSSTLELSQEYERVLDEKYKSSISQYDNFNENIVEDINKWIKEMTKGGIPSLLDESLHGINAMSVWANALYFKGTWTQRFDVSKTESKPFYPKYPDLTTSDEVEMMHGNDFRYTYSFYTDGVPSEDNFINMVMLPYGNESFVFTAILPSEKDPDIIHTLERLTPDIWKQIDNTVFASQSTKKGTKKVYLPKMHLERSIDLIPILQQMGINSLFENISMASSLGVKDIHLSLLRQKVDMNIDEEGTEIKSASMGLIEWQGAGDPYVFSFNRPFIYFVRERSTGAVLLAGIYQHPE